jgi:hypothetical protein
MSSSLSATATTPLLPSSREISPRPPLARDPSTFRAVRRRRGTPPVHLLPALVTITVFILVCFAAWDVSSYGKCYFTPLCRILGDGQDGLEEIYGRNSGAYGPWRSHGPGGGKLGLPRGCEINQVSIVSYELQYLADLLATPARCEISYYSGFNMHEAGVEEDRQQGGHHA